MLGTGGALTAAPAWNRIQGSSTVWPSTSVAQSLQSIVDSHGNAAALTATVEAPFGSSRWVHGFLLNNEMTDFAKVVPQAGETPANAIAPGKRPLSSMSPTIVRDLRGNNRIVIGASGGPKITT